MSRSRNDLFVRLINHRVTNEHSRREDYLTACLGWVLEHDLAFLHALLAPDGPIFVDHPDLAPSPGVPLEIQTQLHTAPAHRPDMVISGTDFKLIVESKVGERFDCAQVERYLGDLGKCRRGGVVAIVPERSLPGADVPDHPRFLGVCTWERVYSLLRELPDPSAAGDEGRGWLLDLMDHYGLVSVEGEVPHWQLEDGTQDIDRVLSICEDLDAVVGQVAGDDKLISLAPHPYRFGGSGKITTTKMTSGKGDGTRPVMCHFAILHSRFHAGSSYRFGVLLDAVLAVEFQRYAGASGSPEVNFSVNMQRYLPRAGRRVAIGDPDAFVTSMLKVLEWAPLDRVPTGGDSALLDKMRQGYVGVLQQVATRLETDGHFVGELDPNAGVGPILRLGRTVDLVEPGKDRTELRQRYSNLLRALLGAFFQAHPERPLRSLLDAVMWDR